MDAITTVWVCVTITLASLVIDGLSAWRMKSRARTALAQYQENTEGGA